MFCPRDADSAANLSRKAPPIGARFYFSEPRRASSNRKKRARRESAREAFSGACQGSRAGGASYDSAMDVFIYEQYQIRRKLFSFIHTDFYLHAPSGEIVLWGRKKGFKLKEDIRLFEDAAMQREVVSIQARQMIDFSATYDILDSRERRKIGALRRKGLRSLLRDEWQLLDADDRAIGTMQEDSQQLALLRRFLTNLVPQSFDVIIGGTTVAEVKQHFNPFRFRLDVDFSLDSRRQLDRRIGVAAAVILSTIEGRQGD
jgi:hypothetical protein